jgi:hypothetical protein
VRCNSILHIENVVDFSIKSVGPDMSAVRGISEFSSYPNAVLGFANTAT